MKMSVKRPGVSMATESTYQKSARNANTGGGGAKHVDRPKVDTCQLDFDRNGRDDLFWIGLECIR
jgi:hypothetical protein